MKERTYMVDIKQLLNSSEYDFLRTNPHLGNNIILLTFGGSYSYGTNIEGSDIDIRGIAVNQKSDLIGMSNFEQAVNEQTDTTIYGFNKIVSLLLNCNPNTIEMLGCKPEHYFYLHPVGKSLIENRKMFLSKKAVYSFGGYANQQLRRLQNALAHDQYPQPEKEKHILGTCKSVMANFQSTYDNMPQGAVKLYIDQSDKEDYETEIFIDANLNHYPLRDFKAMNSELGNVIGLYSKLGKRNTKKDDLHLNKHAMHLIRLYLMCIDILEKGDIITYREADHELLMSIRNGKYQKEDGTFDTSFFDIVDAYEKRMNNAAENSALPDKPDYHKIEQFVMDVNEKVIRNEI